MRLDEFESVFRSAVRPRFTFVPPHLGRVMIVNHLDPEANVRCGEAVQQLLASLPGTSSFELVTAEFSDWNTAAGLLARVEEVSPDLVVTWRNLKGAVEASPWDLGEVVHALSQGCEVPLLLLPDPRREDAASRVAPPSRVLLVTDHLTGDDRLVNWGVALTPPQGHLHLAHVEDEAVFSHYMDAISRLPAFDTEQARTLLLEKLLALPQAYCESLRAELAEHHIDEHVISLVQLGNPIALYPSLVEKHRIDLLVCNTKDPTQRAMGALAHALAVELRDLPLLLL